MSDDLIKAFNTRSQDSTGQAITATDIGSKRALDVALLKTDGTPVDLSSISVLDLYNVNNLEDAIPLYVGLSKSDGTWLMKRFNETTGSMDYANLSNNPSVTTYNLAWTSRATLTYSKYHEITGV